MAGEWMTRRWAIDCCMQFFGLDGETAQRVFGDRGRQLLLQLWQDDPLHHYEDPLQILRQEWFHAAYDAYRHPGFWATLAPNAVVLDWGCGTGEVLREPWIARGGQSVLVEASDACLQYLPAKFAGVRSPPRVFHASDSRWHASAPFDALICTDVLEHVLTPLDVQQDLWALLKPGGHALLKFEKAYPHPGHLLESIAQLPQWWTWLREKTEIIEVETYAWVRKPRA